MDDTRPSCFGCYRETGGYTRGFLLVALISAVSIVQPQRMFDRSIIFKELVERRQQERDEFSRFIPCTKAFIDEYFDHPGYVSLVLPNEPRDIPDFAEPLISELRGRSMIYTLNVGMINVIEMYEDDLNGIILTKNASALGEKDICLANYCKHDCDFVIALTEPFVDEANFLADADELIRRLCLRSIFELAILAMVGDSAVIAGSRSRTDDGLYTPADAAILARCEQRDTIRWQRLADQRTKSSSRENVVNVAMLRNYPYAIPVGVGTDCLRFDGIEGMMVEEIARSLKIQLNRKVVKWRNVTVIEDELQWRLYDTMSSDLMFGGFLWSYSPKIEYTSSYGMVHIVWLVPIHMNVSLRGLILPFTANVWYAIICVLIIGGLVKHLFIRDTSFLDIAALLFGVATNRQPIEISSRIQFIAWALFGFFITQLYLGSLADQLMNASAAQIETIDELMESGLDLGGTKLLANLLSTPDKNDDDSENVRRIIQENFIIFDQRTYIRRVQDIITGRNNSLALLVMLNLTNIYNVEDVGHGHIVKETMGTYPLALATWRSFPYLKDINLKILLFLETGFVRFWAKLVSFDVDYYEEDNEMDDNSNLDIKDITPAFLLLIIGYLGGCLLLIAEILFYPSPVLL
ncbi:uncharacterized protein LOC112589762 [Harpegnathos saltator]|uniref:Ionotropic glutamate receptor C-terminal domain-containing protein n=1 Tax=Harpegnathos saltator TaxID=610380 RepID=E2BIP5_HARSA|nr:uncharacterized protein LOC112589762 [Harpegnathos saltator]EFN84439.1 hypothetical protein EAI_15505 [Harpegnathos saltator]